MKDYSLGKNENFILGYEINEQSIIIHYPGSDEVIPYSSDQELSIIRSMEQQVLDYENCKQELDEQINSLVISSDKYSFWCVFVGIIGMILTISTPVFIIPSAILSFVYLANSHICSKRVNDLKQIMEDYEKSSLFLQNKEKLAKKKLLFKNFSVNGEHPCVDLDINTLDRLSLEVLRNFLCVEKDETKDKVKTIGTMK